MISPEEFSAALDRVVADDDALNALPLEGLLGRLPTLDQLEDLAPGTVVLLRCDLDVPLEGGRVVDLSRLEAASQTLGYGIKRGWRLVILGHLGRNPKTSLGPVRAALKEILDTEIEFVEEWLDDANDRLLDPVVSRVAEAAPGTLFLLENTRRYAIETALWSANADTVRSVGPRMYSLARDIRERLSRVEINEAIAASNLDFSSSVLPLAMSRSALGFYINEELRQHIGGARQANLIVVSGAKFTKLTDLSAMLERRVVRTILSAGVLAMPLKKAQARLAGTEFSMGRAETKADDKGFVSPTYMELSEKIVRRCRDDNIELVLPVDFVLDGGEVSDHIPRDRAQFDVGPKTRELFAKKLLEYTRLSQASPHPFAMFYNGAFGMFEDPRYEAGTKQFVQGLRDITAAGVRTYVGGGEGRVALARFASLSDVTHAFTAGGTILKSMSDRHIPYLKAMYLQNARAEEAARR